MSDLRTRIAAIIDREVDGFWEPLAVADAVIRELNIWIPPIVASAIHSYADSQLAALSHHGHPEAIWELNRLNNHAASIANYATTHKRWNRTADDE